MVDADGGDGGVAGVVDLVGVEVEHGNLVDGELKVVDGEVPFHAGVAAGMDGLKVAEGDIDGLSLIVGQ